MLDKVVAKAFFFFLPKKAFPKIAVAVKTACSQKRFAQVKWHGNGKARDKINFWCMLPICVRVSTFCHLYPHQQVRRSGPDCCGVWWSFSSKVKQTKENRSKFCFLFPSFWFICRTNVGPLQNYNRNWVFYNT